MPSLLDSRGALAGAGSAMSLVAAALVSLLFATGLVAFTSWPASSSGTSDPSVSLPSAPPAGGTPTGAAGRAAASTIVLPASGAPARRRAARTLARPGTRAGSAPVATGAAPPAASPSSGTSQPGTDQSTAPAVTRRVTDNVADTTQAATDKVGSTVSGPAGTAIQTTGDQVAQTVRDVGAAAQPILGVVGG